MKQWTAGLTAAILAAALLLGGCNEAPASSSDTESEETVSSSKDSNIYDFSKVSRADSPKWTYGEKGQDETKQGSNNWYYMYSEETNRNGVYDVSKIKECWYSEIDGGGSCISSSKGGKRPTWVPGIYNKDTDIWASNNWWNQSMESGGMNMSPAVSRGPYASAVLAFNAPEDGNYSFNISFTAGNNEPSNSDNDGVTVSVYGNERKLYSRSIRDDLMEGESFGVNAMLKAGQCCYIIVDPNENGNGDVCHSLRVEVTQTISVYVDNISSWAFGKSYLNGDGTEQGVNNWYYLYTAETNRNGEYDISKIKECWYKKRSDTDPYTNKTYGTWVAGVYDKNIELPTQENHWRQSAYGYFCPAMDNAPYASAVLAWKAPFSGVYIADIDLAAGNIGTEDICDGVTISVLAESKRIYSESIKSLEGVTYHIKVKLEQDESLYLIVDPNNNGLSDFAEELDIVIKKIN